MDFSAIIRYHGGKKPCLLLCWVRVFCPDPAGKVEKRIDVLSSLLLSRPRGSGAVPVSRWVHVGLYASSGPSEEEEREFILSINTVEPCLSYAGPKDLDPPFESPFRSSSPAFGEKTPREHLSASGGFIFITA
jgi:hypothetical protein